MSNISPLDSRYKKQVSELNEYFSEQALMGFRLYVEIKYLIFLSKHRALKKLISLNKKDQQKLEKIYSNFDQKEYNAIKKIEAKTKHDVNAVVQYLSKKIEKNISGALVPWVHFGLTSEDINNTAYSLMIKGAVQSSLLKNLKELSGALKKLVSQNKDFPIMALTHGQPATTTSLGKEMAVFHVRLSRQIEQLKKRDLLAKFSGATGTLAAHKIAFPKGSWVSFSKRFIKTLGLKNNPITTQVEPNDSLAELLQNIIRINNILTDMSVDMWLYVERNIFIQKNRASEVCSSTMPHKINPIAFENAEGNLELANSGLEFLSSRLCRSRLQRDLSGSTLFRNVGTSFGHSLLAYKNIVNGLGRIRPNKNQAEAELENNWEVLAEALQTVLRKNGDADAYEKIKKITRGTGLDREKYLAIVNSLNIAEEDRGALLCLTPSTYLGEIKEILKKY